MTISVLRWVTYSLVVEKKFCENVLPFLSGMSINTLLRKFMHFPYEMYAHNTEGLSARPSSKVYHDCERVVPEYTRTIFSVTRSTVVVYWRSSICTVCGKQKKSYTDTVTCIAWQVTGLQEFGKHFFCDVWKKLPLLSQTRNPPVAIRGEVW